MKAEEVNVNLNELEEFKKRNFEERLRFIEFWANYIKEHSDREWSKQQSLLIDGQYSMSKRFQDNFQEYNRKKDGQDKAKAKEGEDEKSEDK